MNSDWERKKAEDKLGIFSTTTREGIEASPATESASRALREAAKYLAPKGFKPEHYHGSLAVHMFYSEIFSSITFLSQLQEDQRAGLWLSRTAVQDLMKRLNEKYEGRISGKLRSGF